MEKVIKTFEEMDDGESLCDYCACTNYGEYSNSCVTPNGFISCEGEFCENAYTYYVDDVKARLIKMEERFKSEEEFIMELTRQPCINFLRDICQNADSAGMFRKEVLNVAIFEILRFALKNNLEDIEIN